jgi:hypothetical protein
MKLYQRMFTFGIVLMAAMMALNEFPELLTLTDNTTNDYVSVQRRSDSSHQIVVQRSAAQLTAAPAVFNPPVQLQVLAASNFLLSPAAKSPGGLLLLLVTQRT